MSGLVTSIWPVSYIDIMFSGPQKQTFNVAPNHNSMLYVYQNSVKVNGQVVKAPTAVVFERSCQLDLVELEANGDCGALLISGLPINEKISWKGPFVLNTEDQLFEAVSDYRNCKNGFENAKEWRSKIQNKRFEKK